MKEFDQEMLNVFLLTNPPQSHKSSQTEKMDIIEEEEQVERKVVGASLNLTPVELADRSASIP